MDALNPLSSFRPQRGVWNNAEAKMIAVELIVPSPWNARRLQEIGGAPVDAQSITELAASIRDVGFVHPLLVRPVMRDNAPRYEIVAGHRRFQAGQSVGLAEFPCTVRDIDDTTAARVIIIENIHRQDLSRDELAGMILFLTEERRIPYRSLETMLHRDASWVSQLVTVLNDDVVLPRFLDGSLNKTQAIEAARAEDVGLKRRLVAMGSPLPGQRPASAAAMRQERFRYEPPIQTLGPRPVEPLNARAAQETAWSPVDSLNGRPGNARVTIIAATLRERIHELREVIEDASDAQRAQLREIAQALYDLTR